MDLSSVYIPACIRTQSFSSNGIEYNLNFIVVVIHSFLLAPCHVHACIRGLSVYGQICKYCSEASTKCFRCAHVRKYMPRTWNRITHATPFFAHVATPFVDPFPRIHARVSIYIYIFFFFFQRKRQIKIPLGDGSRIWKRGIETRISYFVYFVSQLTFVRARVSHWTLNLFRYPRCPDFVVIGMGTWNFINFIRSWPREGFDPENYCMEFEIERTGDC